VRSFGDHNLGAFPQQHPDWNFQSPATWVHDTDRPISSLRSAKDPQDCTMKRVKRVKDLNIRIVRAQGIVGVGVTTPMSIASCQVAAWRQTVAGLPADQGSSCPFAYSPDSTAGCFWNGCRQRSAPAR
jgi:hypothetical protein